MSGPGQAAPIRRGRSQVVLAVGLLIAVLAVPGPVVAQRIAMEGTIRGRVLEDTTEVAIGGALIEVLDGSTRLRGSTVTDERGDFVLPAVPRGAFRLRVTRLGYVRTITPYWRMEAGEVLTVAVRISPEAVMLAPLEITGRERSQSSVLTAFYRRVDRGNAGTFITREDIERSNAIMVTDLLATVPGVRLESGTGTYGRMVTFDRALPVHGPCPVQVYLDGALAARGGAVPLDEIATPAVLEGIEIYRGAASLPPEFANPLARCGVIALWTRRGG